MEEELKDEHEATPPRKKSKKLKAKKDFLIVQNDERYDIKEGEDISDIPAKFHANLKTENVI